MEEGVEDAQNGYECSEAVEVLTSETVTTNSIPNASFATGRLFYSDLIDTDVLTVEFNGETYELPRAQESSEAEGEIDYGQISEKIPVFNTYPLLVASSTEGNALVTPSAGTYNIKVSMGNASVNTSECFEKAVKASTTLFVRISRDESTGYKMTDKTTVKIQNALLGGKQVVFYDAEDGRNFYAHDFGLSRNQEGEIEFSFNLEKYYSVSGIVDELYVPYNNGRMYHPEQNDN